MRKLTWEQSVELDSKDLTISEKLAIATKTLEIYANTDFWHTKTSHDPEVSSHYTSLEVHPIKDGWYYAEKTLLRMNSKKKKCNRCHGTGRFCEGSMDYSDCETCNHTGYILMNQEK